MSEEGAWVRQSRVCEQPADEAGGHELKAVLAVTKICKCVVIISAGYAA
jgi:hypothetical protein